MRRLLLAALLLAQPAAARETLRGDGEKVTEERKVAGFSRVELRMPIDAEVTEGKPLAVSVTIDRNLLPVVETRVKGDTLIIESPARTSWHGKGVVHISVPELRAFAISGSGDVIIAGADLGRDVELAIDGSGDMTWSGKARALKLHIGGSGDMRLSGSVETLKASIEGSGDIRARDLTAGSASLAISGSGDIGTTLGGGALSASVDGSGDIEWWGKASVEAASVSGSGSIRHR